MNHDKLPEPASSVFEVRVPVDWLLALRLLAAENDERKWINGVSIINGYLLATDGICMGAIPGEQFQGLPSITIPRRALDDALSSPRRLTEKSITLRWTQTENGEMYGSLALGQSRVAFIPDDIWLSKSITSKLSVHCEPCGHPQLDWMRISKFASAAQILGASASDLYKVHLIPNGDDAPVRVKLPKFLDFEGVIMPIGARHCLATESFCQSNEEEMPA